jgi:hypothetical protein
VFAKIMKNKSLTIILGFTVAEKSEKAKDQIKNPRFTSELLQNFKVKYLSKLNRCHYMAVMYTCIVHKNDTVVVLVVGLMTDQGGYFVIFVSLLPISGSFQ